MLLDSESLDIRRTKFCLNFALKSLKNPKTKHMFPHNHKTHSVNMRKREKFKVQQANNDRFESQDLFLCKIY